MRTTARPWRRLAAAVAAVVSLTALAGCSSAVQEARGGGSDAKASDGGTLKIGVATDLQTATPFSNASDATNVLIGLVYDSLVDLPHESLKPKPALATSWKTAADGKSVTLQLRKGVTFHTGRELTSKDVEFSIKQWADPTFAVQFQRTAAAVTGFDTPDPHAITLKFDHPLSNIFDLLDAAADHRQRHHRRAQGRQGVRRHRAVHVRQVDPRVAADVLPQRRLLARPAPPRRRAGQGRRRLAVAGVSAALRPARRDHRRRQPRPRVAEEGRPVRRHPVHRRRAAGLRRRERRQPGR